MKEQELQGILALGREQQGIEFKGPGLLNDKAFFAKVVRAVLSMANRRDGGLVIIGIEEDQKGTPIPTGLSQPELNSWNFDDFADSLSRFADPSVDFDLEVLGYQGANFVILSISEFEDIPVLCKRDYPNILREGACYVRTRRKPETAEIPTQAEMRDLLDLATVKALRRYITIAHTAGLDITDGTQMITTQKFDDQLGDLLEIQ